VRDDDRHRVRAVAGKPGVQLIEVETVDGRTDLVEALGDGVARGDEDRVGHRPFGLSLRCVSSVS
jgi:hypothetical protein